MAGLVQVLAAPRYGRGTGFAKQTTAGSIARALTQSTAASSTPQQLYQPLTSPRAGGTNLIDVGDGTLLTPPPATAPVTPTPPPSSPPPAATQPQPPAGGPSPGASYEADPIYQQILALSQRGMQDAQSGALASKKQALVDYGYDPTLDSTGGARQLFPDESTLLAAQNNPFSSLQQLHRGYDKNLNQIADALNQRNLFYSSARANAEGNAGLDYQGALAQAAGHRDQTLGSIAAALAQAQQQADAERIQGASDAYGRATANPGSSAPPVTPPPDGSGNQNAPGIFDGPPSLAVEDVLGGLQIAQALARSKRQNVALY